MPQFELATFVSQWFWLIVTFGALFFFILPPFLSKLNGVRDEREDRLSGDLKRAQEMRDDAERLLAEYDEKIASARASAQSASKEMQDAVAAKSNAAQAELGDKLATQLAAAESRISDAQAKALGELEGAASEIAQSVVKKLAGVEIDAAAATKAVQAARG